MILSIWDWAGESALLMNVPGESHVGDREPPLWETYIAFREIIKFLKDWQQDCIILTVSSSV